MDRTPLIRPGDETGDKPRGQSEAEPTAVAAGRSTQVNWSRAAEQRLCKEKEIQVTEAAKGGIGEPGKLIKSEREPTTTPFMKNTIQATETGRGFERTTQETGNGYKEWELTDAQRANPLTLVAG